ncbi:MAG: DUF3352 domain-containing protein [Dehalococcoidia bacterium]
MPEMNRARIGIGFGAVLAFTAAAVAAIVLLASGKAGEVDLTTAGYVPADAGVYVAVNTDLSSPSWVSAFDLARRLGKDDPEGALRDAGESEDLNWEADVVPFLGGNAALYVKGFGQIFDVDGAPDMEGGVVVQCNDCARAIMVLRRESGDRFESRMHGDFRYLAGEGMFVSAADDHMFIAPAEGSLFEMLDLAAGEGESLASTEDFKRLRDELSPNFIGFVYVSAEKLAVRDVVEDDAVIRTAFAEAGVGDIMLRPMAMAFGAKKNGFEAQAAAVGDAGTSAPLLEPHESRFAAMVPADTTIFFHTSGIAAAWEAAIAEAGPEVDDAIRMTTEFDSLDQALRAAGSAAGLESIEDVIDLFAGETVFAAWFPEGPAEEPVVAFMADVDDPAAAIDVLVALADAAGSESSGPFTIGETDVYASSTGSGEIWFAAREDAVILGTPPAVEAVLTLQSESLADTGAYRDTLDGLSAPAGTFLYLDLPALLGMVPGGQFVNGIGPAIVNMVMAPADGLARLLAFVSVPE